MSIFSKIFAVLKAVKISDVDKAVAALRDTAIGKAVAADIAVLGSGSKNMTGPEKFEAVVANTLPALALFVSTDSRNLQVKEVEDIGRALVQSVFNSMASTKASTIASMVLKLLGVK